MTSTAPAPEFDIPGDPVFQERYWTFQRWAWGAMAVVTAMAAAGLTGGGGPLAQATASSAGASLDYPRIVRWQRGEQVVLTLPPGDANRSEVLIAPSLAGRLSISAIHPQPREARATPEGLALSFDRARGGKVALSVRPEQAIGRLSAQIRIDDTPPMRLSMIVLP